MLVLGHLGLTLLGGWLFHRVSARTVPLWWLVLGGFLPDLIDKPLGQFILGWGNGRLWGHTLVFLLLLGALAGILRSRHLSAVTGGAVLHQAGDLLPFSDPEAWLWPLFGPFDRGTHAGFPDWWATLLGNPYVQATEILGALLILLLVAGPWLGLWGQPWWGRPGSTASEPGVPQA